MNTVEKYSELAGRILLALIFVMAGLNKIGGYAGTQAYMESAGVPGALLPLVILLEAGGGAAIVVGLLTRWAALGLAVFSIAAAVLFHADFSDQMQQILFMKNLGLAGGLLILFARGAGPVSVDAKLGWR